MPLLSPQGCSRHTGPPSCSRTLHTQAPVTPGLSPLPVSPLFSLLSPSVSFLVSFSLSVSFLLSPIYPFSGSFGLSLCSFLSLLLPLLLAPHLPFSLPGDRRSVFAFFPLKGRRAEEQVCSLVTGSWLAFNPVFAAWILAGESRPLFQQEPPAF